jgi:RNA recognition motif-containing protein
LSSSDWSNVVQSENEKSVNNNNKKKKGGRRATGGGERREDSDGDNVFISFTMAVMNNQKKTVYVGGLADEVDELCIKAAFIPFGDLSEVQMPIDYQTEKHRGFAFVEFELQEDAKAAIDNMVRKTILNNYYQRCQMAVFSARFGKFWRI